MSFFRVLFIILHFPITVYVGVSHSKFTCTPLPPLSSIRTTQKTGQRLLQVETTSRFWTPFAGALSTLQTLPRHAYSSWLSTPSTEIGTQRILSETYRYCIDASNFVKFIEKGVMSAIITESYCRLFLSPISLLQAQQIFLNL